MSESIEQQLTAAADESSRRDTDFAVMLNTMNETMNEQTNTIQTLQTTLQDKQTKSEEQCATLNSEIEALNAKLAIASAANAQLTQTIQQPKRAPSNNVRRTMRR